jgi:drug/metabolite transporter (DMT)-like permease
MSKSESAAGQTPTYTNRAKRRRRRSANQRAFMVLMAIGCLALGVAATVSVVSGGYRLERYEGGIDPVRAAALLSFGAMAAGFGLAATTGLRSFWLERRLADVTTFAFLSGLTVLAATGFLFFATASDSSPPLVPRSSIQVLAYLGLGLVAAGMVPAMVEGAFGAVKRLDPTILIVLIALALIVAIRLALRD